MNSRKILLAALFMLGAGSAFAQSNVLNAKTPDEIGKKTEAEMAADNDNPLPYGYVGDRDIMFFKRVWEVIDLDERINFPLYFPVEDNLGENRKSLFNVLTTAIKDGELTEVYSDSYFRDKITPENIEQLFSHKELNSYGIETMNQYMGSSEDELKAKGILTAEHYDTSEVNAGDVTKYMIEGYWYFDKRQGELKYRMMGICPMAVDALTKMRIGADAEPIQLFWVYFPAARDILHREDAFNPRNSAMPITFDHLLNSRRFSSNIIKVENEYGDRLIEDYLKDNSQMQLLEAERLKEVIRNFEQDMWNY
ncbi:gliding motility protein GldN [Flavobacterium rakeshii]|uniref:Gliding motility protein GldN n=1 Tax=Flavobacterium rakeshii TaxID=1038845 RepID=A0A6N8HBD3_9FLAO|nr:gliding motility protein GldN [Flavobacterium rakeshii]MUV03522.1 gliding motility protein GldN [Flavobacterium rakeshii]